MLTIAEKARATAALDTWYAAELDYRHPEFTYSHDELQRMHDALEAPTVDAALKAFDAEPGTWMTTAEQDTMNRKLMTQIRKAS